MGIQRIDLANKIAIKPRFMTNKHRATLAFWGFMSPLLIGLLMFVYIPMGWGFVLSFFDARASIVPDTFVGFNNYVSMLTDPKFINSMVTFVIFALLIVPLTFVLSLGAALLVNSVRIGRTFFRSVFFMPTACSYVVAALVWKMSFFSGMPYGVANFLIGLFDPNIVIDWIGTARPPWYWLVLVTVRLWLQIGFYMIIFLAGLQEIPRSLYEAAYVDGAAPGWTTFRSITFPLLRNTSISVILLNFIAAFQAFDEFYNVLSNGISSMNLQLVRPPLVYLYQVAFSGREYGRGSAGAFILTGLIIIVTIIQSRLFGLGKAEH